jgi:hypothetical protein
VLGEGFPDGMFVQIWVYFGGPWNENVRLVFGHLESFMVIWYILASFGIFF